MVYPAPMAVPRWELSVYAMTFLGFCCRRRRSVAYAWDTSVFVAVEMLVAITGGVSGR
jgi:hypothetical protein